MSRRSTRQRLLAGAAVTGAAVGLVSLAAAYVATHPIRRRPRLGSPETERIWGDVSFPSRDGVTLRGWLLPAEDAWCGIVLCHGYPNSRQEMLLWARMLRPEGCHLLLFDFRAMGASGGGLCTLGDQEVQDVEGAVDCLQARPEMRGLPIGAFGLSMGGSVALMAAARDERIAAVATHGAFATLDRAVGQRFRLMAGPLARPLRRCTEGWARRWLTCPVDTIAPVESIGRISPRPVLLCHGARDFIVLPEDGELLYHAAGPPKELYVLPRSWHGSIHADDLPAYRQRLVSFFREHLRTREG